MTHTDPVDAAASKADQLRLINYMDHIFVSYLSWFELDFYL